MLFRAHPLPLRVHLFPLPVLLTRQKSFFIYDSVINLCVFANKYTETLGSVST